MTEYIDDKKLGSGGFGEVYLCVRETDGEAFAKKILIDTSDDAIQRFRREVQILSKLNHPRIVTIGAKRLTTAPYWYVMPLYEHSLRDLMPRIQHNRKLIGTVFASILQ